MRSMVEGACPGRCVARLAPSARFAGISPVNGGG